jgi:hypothetical protein
MVVSEVGGCEESGRMKNILEMDGGDGLVAV